MKTFASRIAAGLLTCLVAGFGGLSPPAAADPQPAIAMHGIPALPPDFASLPFVNANAPKGGRLTQCALGTYDSFNPFIVRGLPLQQVRNYVVESLMTPSADEPFTLYGLLADSIETDDARSFATFAINPRATFSDGKPVTADDVLFSWSLLRDHGRPNHRAFYAKVERATKIDARHVRFEFPNAGDRELPLILAFMPILPRHAWSADTFEQTSLTPPLGSGPYRATATRPGATATLERNREYWARDLPIARGLWNFDTIRFDFYRDDSSLFEAFKRGLCDTRIEHDPLRWRDGYDFPAARDGTIIREAIAIRTPQPSTYFVFNTRKPLFADARVRRAMTLLFDFAWLNRAYFGDLYARSGGYFAGSDLSAYGRPPGAGETALLAPYSTTLAPDILDGTFRLPQTDGSGRDRDVLRAAIALLAEADYRLSGETLRDSRGEPVRFEVMVATRDHERIALAFARDLKRAGIAVDVRPVDAVQFEARRNAFEFDMIPNRWDQSLSPGNEQAFYWGSDAAARQGSRNYMGIRDPAVDAMIAALLAARAQGDFVDAVRALDRALMAGFYTIPVYNVRDQWIARSKRVIWPSARALAGSLPETWWASPDVP